MAVSPVENKSTTPAINKPGSSLTPKSVTSSIDALIKKATESRQVSANVDGSTGSLSSEVTSLGDKSLFSAAEKSLGKQDFLNLLVTQLKYQDPLSPSENTEFVAQLAQFSSLEGTQNISDSVDKLNTNMEGLVKRQEESAATLSESTAVSLIGKKAKLKLSELQWHPTDKNKFIEFNVHAPTGKDVLIAITNAKGQAIQYVEAKGGGDKKLAWNGGYADGSFATPGSYGVKVVSRDDLSTEAGYVYLEDRVTAVNYTPDGIKMQVGSQEVPFEQVASLLNEEPDVTAKTNTQTQAQNP